MTNGRGWFEDQDELSRGSGDDLFYLPALAVFSGWVNIFEDHFGCTIHATKEAADHSAQGLSRVACIRVETVYKRGDGL